MRTHCDLQPHAGILFSITLLISFPPSTEIYIVPFFMTLHSLAAGKKKASKIQKAEKQNLLDLLHENEGRPKQKYICIKFKALFIHLIKQAQRNFFGGKNYFVV